MDVLLYGKKCLFRKSSTCSFVAIRFDRFYTAKLQYFRGYNKGKMLKYNGKVA